MELHDAFMKSFRVYDVRGVYPSEVNEEMFYQTTKAFIEYTKASKIIIGRDARQMNPSLFEESVRAATEAGVDVVDLGLITTDMLYFAAGHLNLPGFSITASHNPPEYSGIKMILSGAVAMTADTGLDAIRDLAIQTPYVPATEKRERMGRVEQIDLLEPYLDHILSFVDVSRIRPTKVVVNTMYGVASNVVKGLAKRLPLELVPLNFEIDGTYPKGSPNPMLTHLQKETIDLVRQSNVAFGVAWDGDADRCMFWDEKGNFVEGYYTGVMLADNLLSKADQSGEKVIHCARLGWLLQHIARERGGIALECKTGHGFIKEMMRKENALFAEEMSGHFYFRDNFFADNGMIPFLIVLEMVSVSGQTLSGLVRSYQEHMQISGEFNFRLPDAQATVRNLQEHFHGKGTHNTLDGITVEFDDWRFNVRLSNNEPLLRLNVEGRSQALVDTKLAELQALIGVPPAQE